MSVLITLLNYKGIYLIFSLALPRAEEVQSPLVLVVAYHILRVIESQINDATCSPSVL